MNNSEKIIKLFHDAGSRFVSGEDIAKNLKISRTAVWNHIEKLKNIGYCFEAVTNLGYRLVSVPDKLLPEEISRGLKTGFVGKKIISYESTSSTNDVAYKLALEGACEGTVVLSEFQEKGRGRLKRKWQSPPGKNILVSVILRPHIRPQFAPIVTIMSSVAVACAIKEYTRSSVSIKWPNDVLVNEKKISGILLEQKSEIDRIDFIIVGLGVNVNMDFSDFTDEIKSKSSSLKIINRKAINRIELLKKILFFIENKYLMVQEGKYNDIIKEWIEFSISLGKRVIVKREKEVIEGDAIGVKEDGSLLVKDNKGIVHNIYSGDLELNAGH